jgi:hypothetical protein
MQREKENAIEIEREERAKEVENVKNDHERLISTLNANFER